VPEQIVSRILGLGGYQVVRTKFNERRSELALWVRPTGTKALRVCGSCGKGVWQTHSHRVRWIRDLPWGQWKVWLVVEVHRLPCPRCGVTTEEIHFLDGKLRSTRRLCEAVSRDCEDAPVQRVAAKWGIPATTVRRMDKRVLSRWSAKRKRRKLRWMGVDEIFWKKGECLTVVSDLDAGEPIWAAPERKKETLDRFFTEVLTGRRRKWVEAVCVDMWEPYLQSIRQHLPEAAIVFDKFHVMKHVNAAVDETRRAEFFRLGGAMRGVIRGKRWLFLTRWGNLTRSQRGRLNEVFALNRRLFKAYVLKEQIEHLWTYSYEGAVRRFLANWILSIRWQRLPAFHKLAATLVRHLDGILAYCHHKVPFGLVEAINANIRSMIRRGRGYRDHDYLILKVRKSTAQARLLRAA